MEGYLVNGYIKGKLEGFKSGHALNNKLLHEVFADDDAWRVVKVPSKQNQTMLDRPIN